jgi:hypothetical protein
MLNSYRCYPEHDWKVWKFQGATKGLWKDFPQQHRAFFDWLGSRLNVKTLDDWYKFKTSDIKNIGDKNILDMYGNTLIHALTSIYPEHPWKIFRFQTVTDGNCFSVLNLVSQSNSTCCEHVVREFTCFAFPIL